MEYNRYRRRLSPDAALDALAFGGAALLFVLTRFRGPYPGEPAAWTAAVAGISPFPPLTHPLYAGLARIVAAVPAGALSARLALFSALCAAAAVALLGRIVRAFPPLEPSRPEDAAARRLAGAVASFALAFAFPFWFAATRAAPEPLALALLLGALDRLARYEHTGRAIHGLAFAFLYGLAAVEHPAALWFAPPVLAAAAVIALRRAAPPRDGLLPDRVPWSALLRRGAAAAAAALAGLIPWLLYALWYARQPAAELRDLSGFGPVALELARAYYRSLNETLPPVGWLLIAAFAAAPCVWLALAPFLSPRVWFVRPGHAFLCAALGLLSIGMLLLDAVLPAVGSALLVARVLPAAATAFALGRLAAWARPGVRTRGRLDPPGAFARARALWGGAIAVYAAGLLAAPALNGRLLRSAARQRCTAYARDAARALGGRHWLLLESAEDEIVAVALAEAGAPARVLRPDRDALPAYRRHLAAGFADPRLRDVAMLGIEPLLAEWLSRAPGRGAELAALGLSAPWQAAGRRAIPVGPLTRGADEGPVPGLEALARGNLDFALRYEGLAAAAAREPWPRTARWNALVAMRVSRAANDTGVLLEEEGRPDLAAEAYAAALRVHPDNLSALMNAALLHGAEDRAPPAELVERLRTTVEDLRRADARVNAWALIRAFGEVRRPDVYARRGLLWAHAGRAAAAEADWRRAGPAADPLRRTLEDLRLAGAPGPEGEAALRAIAERGNDPAAWLALFRRALHRGDPGAAGEALDRAAAAGADPARMERERALLDWTGGRREEARRALHAALRHGARDYEALALLAAMAAEADETAELDRLLARLHEARDELGPDVLRTVARIELARGGIAPARAALERAERKRPGDPAILELLLHADVAEARRSDALARATAILAADPEHAFANRVLGSIRIHEGDLVAAETALRRSLARERDPGTLNDLAHALVRRQRFDEAVTLAREAVERAPGMAAAWDTLGDALRRAGRPAEAEEALRRAIALNPSHPVFLWNLARTCDDLGRGAEASEIDDALAALGDDLPPEIRRELAERRAARPAPEQR